MDRTAATATLVAALLAVGFAGATAGFVAVDAQEDPTRETPTPTDQPPTEPTPTDRTSTDPTPVEPTPDAGNATDDRTITVSGQGSAEAPPDRAVVSVAVVAEGDDPAAVRDDLAAGADALRRALADEGVPDEAVDTTEYRIEEPHRSPYETPDGAPDDPAYRGVHGVKVTVDVDRTGPVVDAAAGAGADVRYVSFELSEERRADLRDRALKAAMDDARRQAETLAAAGDLQVAGVRSIDASDRGYGPAVLEEGVATDAGGGETQLRPDDVTVRVDVRVTYDAAA